MSVKSIVISHIDAQYTHEYVANLFWNQQLARIKKIALVPYRKDKCVSGKLYFRAYILIDSWCETEAAYGFISRLHNNSIETRIMYQDEEWWTVSINEDPYEYEDIYTLTFDRDYFEEMNYEDSSSDEDYEPDAFYPQEFDLDTLNNVTLRPHKRQFFRSTSCI